MRRLNGWQRIWVALSVVWTLIIAGMAYAFRSSDVYVFHPSDYNATPLKYKPSGVVIARMKDPSVIRENCESPPSGVSLIRFDIEVPALSSPVSVCFHFPSAKVGDRMRDSGKIHEWDGALWAEVPDDPGKPPSYGERLEKVGNDIEAEYKRAHAEEQRQIRRTQWRNIALIWVLPPVALYAIGWTVGWIRQGFKASAA